MLDHHPRLAVANDTHFITRAIPNEIPGIDPPLTPQLVEWVGSYRRFGRLGLPDTAVEEAATGSRTYSEFVCALYSQLATLHEKPLAGEKTPDYVQHLPLLHGLFPWVRSIHIIRDGRDVALSALNWAHPGKGPGKFELWQEEPIAVCAMWWQGKVNAGRVDGANLGPSKYREIRYEQLVARPQESLRELAAFLELPFAPQMLTYYEGKTRHNPGLSAKSAWLPPTAGLRDWRTQMSERDLELFEALAGDLLSAVGYERAAPPPSPKIAALADRCRRWWESRGPRRSSGSRE